MVHQTRLTAKGRPPLLVLVDGHALLHRAWHAIREPLSLRRTGEDVRAVYGFLNTLLRTTAEWRPTYCAVAFDLPTPTLRHRLFEQYKAHRPPTPPELHAQLRHVREAVEALGVPVFEAEGFEADDVLGTLCRQAENLQVDTLILTGDTDTLQLVSPRVRVLMTYSVQKRAVYDEAAVRERYGGLPPGAVADLKALQGDPSDNIPGVPGVGQKTAILLLSQFGSVEGIYQGLDRVKPPRLQDTMRENRDVALSSKRLTTIVRDVPVELDLEVATFGRYDRARAVEVLRDLEFFSLVPRLPGPEGGDAAGEPAPADASPRRRPQGEYRVVDTEDALDSMVRALRSGDGFAFDTETTTLDAVTTDLVGLSFSNAPGGAWYVPVGHAEGRQLPLDRALAAVGPLLDNDRIPKVAHNANFDMTVLAGHGVGVRNLAFDTMIAAHLFGLRDIGLKALALECLHEEMTPITDLIGTGKAQTTMAQVTIERAAPYAGADADFTWRLRQVLATELSEKGLEQVFASVEMPLVPVLVRMQRNGVAVDTALLGRLSVEFGEQMAEVQARAFELVGHQLNLNSSKQLAEVLFKDLRLPPTRRTQTGHSTDAASLEGLKEFLDAGAAERVDPRAAAVLDAVLEYRQVAKIKSTYLDSLPALVNPATGRVHTSYNQTGSSTGRISSNDPNVQNIPVRTELGRRVRKAFVAQGAPEKTLLAADYSQIELRVLAHLSGDPGLVLAFQQGEDIHAATASSVYGVPLDRVDADMRRVAKIMNFGVIYGLSSFGISRQTGLSREEGAAFIQTYFGKYPGIRDYIERVKAQVRRQGYVQTLLGRRRYIPEASSANANVRAAGERMAVNMPIQGTAADIIKIAMVRIQARLDALRLRSLMIIQVHDELIFEVPRDELEAMRSLVLELMPSAMDLVAPLSIEIKVGTSWGDME